MEQKILLLEHPRITAASHYNDVANAPLSTGLISGYIASVMRENNFSVEIYDGCLCENTFEQCFKRLQASDYSLLGVHAVYCWEHTAELFYHLKKLRMLHPELSVILYGFFPTFAYNKILELYSFIDAVIIGEPESTFAELAGFLKQPGPVPYERISGIAFKDNGTLKINKPRPQIENLDRLPFPLRTETSIRKIGGSLLGSRGCYGNCVFCCINPFYGSGACWRGRSAADIACEIESLLPSLTGKYLYFLDANFFGKGRDGVSRALAVADEIKSFGKLEFGLECRCDDIGRETLPQMVKAGLRDVFLGIESASPGALKRMQKGINSAKNEIAVSLLRSHGIEPDIGFIMYEPDSSLNDIRANYEFLRRNRLLNRLCNSANILYHREIILRGMPHYKSLDDAGRLQTKDALGYEGFYRFSDRSVQFIADLMSAVCRKVLMSTESDHSTLCWKKGATAASGRLNDFLTAFFEEVLRKLEMRELPLRETELIKYQEIARHNIERSAVEERVGQI